MIEVCECAWRTKDGFCRLHKVPCTCAHDCSVCADAVRRAQPLQKKSVSRRQIYDTRTVKGRMQFATQGVCGGIVYSQCTGKTRYPTWSRAAEVMRSRIRHGSGPLRIYPCQFCGGYHLTHKMQHEKVNGTAA